MSVTRVVAANRLNLENGNIFDINVWIVDQDRIFFGQRSVRTSKGSTTPEVASEASFRVKLLGKWESNSCNSTLHQPCSRSVTTELAPSYQPQKGQATAVQQYCRQDLGEVAQAAGIPHAGVPVTLDVVHAGADVTNVVQ